MTCLYLSAPSDEVEKILINVRMIEMGGGGMNSEICEMWKSFKKEIIQGNRYFFNNDIVKVLSRVECIRMFEKGRKFEFFRARKGDYEKGEEKEMLNPPADMTSAGRCNPQGISYLYLAMEKETAVKEIRWEKDDKEVTIAKFEVDLSNVFSFLPYEKDYMINYIKDVEAKMLITIINEEMGTEFTDNSNGLKYIPLQFISEYIKKIGFDGFMYRSVVDNRGMNLVMFDNKKVRMLSREKMTGDEIESMYGR